MLPLQHSALHLPLIYYFKKDFIKKICTMHVAFNKEIDTDKYISEILENFSKCDSPNRSKFSPPAVIKVKKREKINYAKTKTNKKYHLTDNSSINKISITNTAKGISTLHFTGNIKYILDVDTQSKIDILLAQRSINEAREIIFNCIENEKIPSFNSLQRMVSILSQEGDVCAIKKLQNVAKQFYKFLIMKQDNFDNYLCEALFRSGNHQEGLELLRSLFEKGSNERRLKETIRYIIKYIPEAKQNYQEQAFEIVNEFISKWNNYKLAIIFWEISLISKQYHLCKLCESLLEKHSDFLLQDKVVIKIVDKMYLLNDPEIIQCLIEMFLKAKDTQALSLALSAQLKILCSLGNLKKGKEIIIYANEMKLQLSADAVKDFSNLISEKHKFH